MFFNGLPLDNKQVQPKEKHVSVRLKHYDIPSVLQALPVKFDYCGD